MIVTSTKKEKLSSISVEFYLIPSISFYKSKDAFTDLNIEMNVYWFNYKWNIPIINKQKNGSPQIKIINKS